MASGANLTLIVPLLSAAVPIAGIAVAVLVYGESASLSKVAMLVAACGLVATANLV